jgi:hypothetical protein
MIYINYTDQLSKKKNRQKYVFMKCLTIFEVFICLLMFTIIDIKCRFYMYENKRKNKSFGNNTHINCKRLIHSWHHFFPKSTVKWNVNRNKKKTGWWLRIFCRKNYWTTCDILWVYFRKRVVKAFKNFINMDFKYKYMKIWLIITCKCRCSGIWIE